MAPLGLEIAHLAQWPAEQRLLGLKRILPKSAVQAVLRQTGHDRRFCPRLPAWFVVWFVIALGLFTDSYRQIFRWLQPYRKQPAPGRSALCQARQRLGIAPLRLLADRVIRLLARPTTPGAFHRHYRLMAIDGFRIDLPDTPANARAFGRPGSGRAPGAFPQARVTALCEIGTHVLWRWLIKPGARAELVAARYLLQSLDEDMLLLWDRHYFSYATVQSVLDRGAHVLARVKGDLILEPLWPLKDGSYVAKVYPSPKHRRRDQDGLHVRVIEYTITDPARSSPGQKHRLLTTLPDAQKDPAADLVVLYHQRWEEELAIDEIKTHQRERPVLRSQTPAGVVQEVYGLLLGHYVVRSLMAEAAEREGQDPRRLSFVGALRILRCRWPECPKGERQQRRWYEDLLAEVGEEVLAERRERSNPRVIKRKMSNWKKKRPEHRRWPQPTKEFRQAISIGG